MFSDVSEMVRRQVYGCGHGLGRNQGHGEFLKNKKIEDGSEEEVLILMV